MLTQFFFVIWREMLELFKVMQIQSCGEDFPDFVVLGGLLKTSSINIGVNWPSHAKD